MQSEQEHQHKVLPDKLSLQIKEVKTPLMP